MTVRKAKPRQATSNRGGAAPPRFPIVGIGASAGGLRALQRLLGTLSGDTGMAFVVIVHLDPDHESHLADLLQKRTAMPVAQVTRTVKLAPDHVYIIPPDRDLSLDDGHIRLVARRQPARNHAPIDFFFRTLAETREADAVGVILSGTGSDGAQGIKWIHERGGVTLVQSPDDADYDGMPQSALSTGQVDVALSAPDLGAKLGQLHGRTAFEARVIDADKLGEDESNTLAKILTHVRVKTGHDFSGYKRATIVRRLERRMQLNAVNGLAAYLELVRIDAAETQVLFNDLLIVVTSFFRDPDAIAALEREVVPALFAGKGPDDVVRVWTAGCATGEEAYTVAMLLCEHADGLDEPPGIQIFATDVHEQAFTAAREGVYAESIVADVSAERLERFFIKEPGGYRVKKAIREKVLFATHNLLRDPPFLRLDLVSCRNVLIYLGRDTQERVFEAFHFALNPRAFLFLGSSESPDGTHLFASFDKAHHIFQAAPHVSRRTPRPSAIIVRDARVIRGATTPLKVPAFSLASLHQQLVEAYGPPSVVVNGDERVVHLSNRVGRFLERPAGEPTDKLFDMISGDLRLETRRLLRTALRTGKRVEAHGVIAVVEGAKRRVDVTVQPLSEAGARDARSANFALVLFDENGPAPRSVTSVTKRATGGRARTVEQLEAELRSIQARLRAADAEHDATMEALRASNEELQSITEEQRAVSEELETSKEELQSINEELRTINQEHRMRNEELAEVNSDLVNLIDSTGIGTVFLDRDLQIRRFTPALAELFNVMLSDRGRPLGDITNRLDYGDLEADARRVFTSLATCEREVSSKDGRWFVVRITPYRSADHTIDGVVLTFVDTSERKRIEIDREKLLLKVQETSTVKSNFIGVMSHEFRTPLNAIIGYADLLDVGVEGPLSLPQRAQVARITANAHHLARMVDEILSSARLENQVDVAKWERVDVDSLAHEIIEAVEPLARTKHLTVRVNAAAGPSPILTDGTKLRQILFNLMGNAIRFTDAGSIELRVRAAETSTVIEVEDTGIGIAPEHLNRVFERFWQADQTQTRTRGGTGLGLMVVESLTKSVGGTVEVQSELGRGSVFRVRLPDRNSSQSASVRGLPPAERIQSPRRGSNGGKRRFFRRTGR